jgi:hypothetical protein
MVILKTNRTGYSPEQVENSTITVGELIDLLENENRNEKIVLSNDNGYTYGYINENSISEI